MTPKELDELYLTALQAEEAGDYDAALAMFRRGAEFGDSSAYNAIGLAYDSGQGVEQDKVQAIEWFKKAWNNGENRSYIANIAITYAQIDEFEQADEWWIRAVDGGDKSAHLGYAQFLMKSQQAVSHAQIADLVRVTAHASTRLEVSENDKDEAQELLRNLRRNQVAGNSHRTEEDRVFEANGETAVEYFENALQSDAQNRRAAYFLMLLAINRDDVPTALSYARKTRALNSHAPNLNLNIGRIYALAGNYDKAISHYKKELAVQPDDELTCFFLGEIYFKRHHWNKANFYFKKIQDSLEWEMAASDYLWRIYHNTGQLARERQIYRRMLENNPFYELALQNLGATYLDTRDYARALELSGQAKMSDPNNRQIDRNIARARRGLTKAPDA